MSRVRQFRERAIRSLLRRCSGPVASVAPGAVMNSAHARPVANRQQPRLPTAVWTVTELADGSSHTWESRSRGVTVAAAHVVEPHPDGSRLTLALTDRSAVRKRLAADAVADQALRGDGGRLDQDGRVEEAFDPHGPGARTAPPTRRGSH